MESVVSTKRYRLVRFLGKTGNIIISIKADFIDKYRSNLLSLGYPNS